MSKSRLVVSCVLSFVSMAVLLNDRVAADVITYQLPGSTLTITLQGKVKYVTGNTATYRHPKFGTLKLDTASLDVKKVQSVERRFIRRLRAAAEEGPEEVLAVGDWCLLQGYMEGFDKAVDKCLEMDSTNKRARTIKKLQARMAKSLPESPKVEAYMRRHVTKKGMKVVKSKHYILLHDTPDAERGKSRAEERLELLESVYESFMLKFFSQGVELKIPKYRMMVVLFQERDDFLAFSKKLGPDMASVAGFWHTVTNLAVFFDQGESDRFEAVRKLERIFAAHREEAIRNRKRIANVQEIVRNADALDLILKMAREDADVEVVSHEATHQLAGNTGLFPRHVRVPSWIHEGLATYFESPEDASWGGVGAVNEDRLRKYRTLAADTEHSNVKFIVGDQIFRYAGDLNQTLHGYAQAWALTHFLVERHFDEYMAFCQRLGEMPPDVILSPDVLTSIFEEVCESELDSLNAEWRRYMKSLKTDIDRILNDEAI